MKKKKMIPRLYKLPVLIFIFMLLCWCLLFSLFLLHYINNYDPYVEVTGFCHERFSPVNSSSTTEDVSSVNNLHDVFYESLRSSYLGDIERCSEYAAFGVLESWSQLEKVTKLKVFHVERPTDSSLPFGGFSNSLVRGFNLNKVNMTNAISRIATIQDDIDRSGGNGWTSKFPPNSEIQLSPLGSNTLLLKKALVPLFSSPHYVIIENGWLDSIGFVRDCSFGFALNKDEHPCKSHFDVVGDSKKTVHVDIAVALTTHYGRNYFHLLIESLPRLAAIADVVRNHPDTIKVLIPQDCSFCGSMLDYLFGISPEQLVEVPRQGGVIADVLILPTFVRCGVPSYPMGNIFRHVVWERFGWSPGSDFSLSQQERDDGCCGRRPVVIVHRVGRRSLVNEAELFEALRINFPQEHFVAFVAEGISSTVSMFRCAKAVISPHGAGLSNIIFSPKDVKVFEILHPTPNFCFFALARSLGMEYHGVSSSIDNNEGLILDVHSFLQLYYKYR